MEIGEFVRSKTGMIVILLIVIILVILGAWYAGLLTF